LKGRDRVPAPVETIKEQLPDAVDVQIWEGKDALSVLFMDEHYSGNFFINVAI